MGNTHDSEMARLEADHVHTKWKTIEDYRWGYTGDRGPETWWIHYPSASGAHQSPLDIITEETWLAEPESGIVPLEIYYSENSGGGMSNCGGASRQGGFSLASEDGCGETLGETKILLNTGNTSRINFINSNSYMSGGPCKQYCYVLEQIHLHWGDSDNNGSEHHVNGRPHSAEVHLVHWNEDLYSSYEEAVISEDGVLIIAVFVQVSETKSNEALTKWSQRLEDILYREENVPLSKDFPYAALLPNNLSKFWTYHGSFTTPPCYETVTWVVLEQCIFTSSKVLSKFRNLRCYGENEERPTDDQKDGQIMSNHRAIQPIGVRKICYVNINLFRGPHDGEHQQQYANSGSQNGGAEKKRPFLGHAAISVKAFRFDDSFRSCARCA